MTHSTTSESKRDPRWERVTFVIEDGNWMFPEAYGWFILRLEVNYRGNVCWSEFRMLEADLNELLRDKHSFRKTMDLLVLKLDCQLDTIAGHPNDEAMGVAKDD